MCKVGTKRRDILKLGRKEEEHLCYAEHDSLKGLLVKYRNEDEDTRISWLFLQLLKKGRHFAFQSNHVVSTYFGNSSTKRLGIILTKIMLHHLQIGERNRKALDLVFSCRKSAIAASDFIYIK